MEFGNRKSFLSNQNSITMEIGKYYADGEGFYRAIEKETHGKNNVVIMETVMTKDHSVSHYNNISFIEEACDKRMVECTKEQFELAKEKALAVIDELYQFNSDVFLPLWKKKIEQ